MKETIFIGSDHAGFDLKQDLIAYFEDEYDMVDCGPTSNVPGDDYPDYAKKVCQNVLSHHARGIVICDTGVGMCMAANRFSGIRAALVFTPFMATRSREHNNANVLCLGQEIASTEDNEKITKIWLETPFSNDERHVRRLNKLDTLT